MILGRGSMRASDPPPVMVETRRGSTNRGPRTRITLSGTQRAERGTCTTPRTRTSLTDTRLGQRGCSVKGSSSRRSRRVATYGTVCHGQKVWQGVQRVRKSRYEIYDTARSSREGTAKQDILRRSLAPFVARGPPPLPITAIVTAIRSVRIYDDAGDNK